MTIVEFLAITIALAVYFSTFYMKTMITLRLAAIASNLAWMFYGLIADSLPIAIVQILLLPLNVVRLVQIRRLVADAIASFEGGVSIDALLPYMNPRKLKPGEVLFAKGEISQQMFYLVAGSIRLVELDTELDPGSLFGEIAMYSPSKERTATAVAVGPVKLMEMDESTMLQLYFQEPKFGFYLIRLITGRLIENNLQLQAQLRAERFRGGDTDAGGVSPASDELPLDLEATPLAPIVEAETSLPMQELYEALVAPDEPRQKWFQSPRLLLLAILVWLVAIPMVGWQVVPYVRAVFSYEAIITTRIGGPTTTGSATTAAAKSAAGRNIITWLDCKQVLIDVLVPTSLIPQLKEGMAASVTIEGELQSRRAKVSEKPDPGLGLVRLVTLAKVRGRGEAQVLLTVNLSDLPRCPIGRGATVEFPDVPLWHIIRSRLQI